VERAEAEAIVDGDRETVIGLLLRLDEVVAANERLVVTCSPPVLTVQAAVFCSCW
jgi:hypothetical protein